ncbi:MAG: lysylphosphatidylglycerol synthase transmembrane domain-containing protein [Bacteroidia bacterium]
MNPKAKSILQFILLLGLGGFLVWLSLKSVSDKKEEIYRAFQQADYFWVILSSVVALFAHFLRAYRWNYLLEPLGHKTTLINANCAVMISYFANYGLPRMGELTRCTVVSKYDDVPFEEALGTVITERIVDMILLIVIFVLTLFAQFSQLIGLANKYIFDPLGVKLHNLSENPVTTTILVILIIGFFIALFLLRKRISHLLKGKFGNIILGFTKGITSIKNIKHKWRFIFLSIGIWAAYFYSLYLIFFAFEETSHLGQSECLTLMLFGTLGVIFTPGGLGVYHSLIKEILVFYGISEITGFSFPWLAWGSQFILIVVLGLFSLILLPIINKSKANVVS